jgi:hypothetical protein
VIEDRREADVEDPRGEHDHQPQLEQRVRALAREHRERDRAERPDVPTTNSIAGV